MSEDIHERVARKILEGVFGVTAHTKTLDFTAELLRGAFGEKLTLLARATEALDKIGSIDPRDVEFIRKVLEELHAAERGKKR